MDIRSLERIAQAIGELGNKIEDFEKASNGVADSISRLIQEIGKAIGMEEKEVARRVTEFQVGWSGAKESAKTQEEEIRKKLLDMFAEMIKRGDC